MFMLKTLRVFGVCKGCDTWWVSRWILVPSYLYQHAKSLRNGKMSDLLPGKKWLEMLWFPRGWVKILILTHDKSLRECCRDLLVCQESVQTRPLPGQISSVSGLWPTTAWRETAMELWWSFRRFSDWWSSRPFMATSCLRSHRPSFFISGLRCWTNIQVGDKGLRLPMRKPIFPTRTVGFLREHTKNNNPSSHCVLAVLKNRMDLWWLVMPLETGELKLSSGLGLFSDMMQNFWAQNGW